MAELGALARGLFQYLVEVGGLSFAVLAAATVWLALENRVLKRRVETLSDRLIEDGRDATEKLLDMSAAKLMNEASLAEQLRILAVAVGTAGEREGRRR